MQPTVLQTLYDIWSIFLIVFLWTGKAPYLTDASNDLLLSSELLNERSESSFYVAQGLPLGFVKFGPTRIGAKDF